MNEENSISFFMFGTYTIFKAFYVAAQSKTVHCMKSQSVKHHRQSH